MTTASSGDASATRVVRLAASAFVVLAAEPLFLLVDTAVVGHLGQVALAALGAGGTLMGLLAIVGTSLAYGTTGRAARWYGAGQRDAAVGEGVQASWLALLVGGLGILAGQLLAGWATRLIAGEGEVAEAAESWLRIAILGLPGILLVFAGNGWLRGVQDTRTPVVVVVVANVVSAVISPVLVYPVGLGLVGSAWANVAAQWLGGGLCLWALARERVPVRPRWSVMQRQLMVSRDLVVRSAAFQIAFLTAAAVAGRAGAAQLAAHQVGLQLWNLAALLLDSFAIAAQSLVGAALGGGDVSTAKSTAWRVSRFGLVAGVVLAGVFGLLWFVVPYVFTDDDAVREQLGVLWPFLVAMVPVGGIVFALDGVLLGAGDNAYIRNVTVGSALLGFVPVTLATALLGWGLAGVWTGLAVFIAVRFVGMVWRTRSGAWARVGASL
ncbi:MATE family efflux transporter [Cryptosporangium aurantiacum]|uniref:Putative efflux protein, MATE family n=1 Tax=Cryptosporangium aurantiacum TaxID=134849 RepID=A0A1M7JYN8_9ACTN|nr:MATE family efflux transporter [Cryptosporangium aurantiacum]SHM58192.1 putative efflux protein, MATE family [Cryptosporangium aurantiacum]